MALRCIKFCSVLEAHSIRLDPWKLGAQFPEKTGPVDGGVKAPFSKI